MCAYITFGVTNKKHVSKQLTLHFWWCEYRFTSSTVVSLHTPKKASLPESSTKEAHFRMQPRKKSPSSNVCFFFTGEKRASDVNRTDYCVDWKVHHSNACFSKYWLMFDCGQNWRDAFYALIDPLWFCHAIIGINVISQKSRLAICGG